MLKHPHWEAVAVKASAMIRNSPGVQKRYPLTSNLEAYLISQDTMTEYAASLASEMTTSVTCKFAYRNDMGSYIENDDILTPAYYKSRTPGVLTLLVKAGIRLGALLDALAMEYYDRKAVKERVLYDERIALAASRIGEQVPTPEPRPDSNPYTVLAIDCDPESLVEDDDTTAIDSISPQSSLVSSKPDTVKRSPKKKKALNESTDSPKAIVYEGVDLNWAILIRRKGQFVITDKRLVDSHKYTPMNVRGFNVRFDTTGEVKFYFDMTVFPDTMSEELAVRTILKLNGIILHETESIASYVKSTGISRDPEYLFAEPSGTERVRPGFTAAIHDEGSPEERMGQLELAKYVNGKLRAEQAQRQADIERRFRLEWSLRFQSIALYMESQLKAQRSQVVVLKNDRMKMFVLTSTLQRPADEGLRFNFIPFQAFGITDGEKGKTGVLIDPAIFDGYITPSIATTLQSIEQSNKSLSRKHARTRSTLEEELDDVCLLFYGTDRDRLSRKKVIVDFFVYPGDDLSRYLVFQWTIVPGTLY